MTDSLTPSNYFNQLSIVQEEETEKLQQQQQMSISTNDQQQRVVTHKKSVCPTVTYLKVFPEAGDSFKADENGDGNMQPCRPVEEETLHTGKYLELTKYIFKDSLGNECTAEGVHMVKQVVDHKPKNGSVIDIPNQLGNLCTIAVLKKQIMCDALVLTKQYRAPLKAYTIEFPASVSSVCLCVNDLNITLFKHKII